MVDQADRDVVKDASYFDDLRKAVRGSPPTALLGTSGLVVYQRIEAAQASELGKQLKSVRDDELREQLNMTYSRYLLEIVGLRFVTGALPWVTIVAVFSWMVDVVPNKGVSRSEFLGIIAVFLGLTVILFTAAKLVQFVLWRLGSALIRDINRISAFSDQVISASVPRLDD